MNTVESEPSIVQSEEEEASDGLSEDQEQMLRVPSAEDMEIRRQRMLRGVCAFIVPECHVGL